LVVLRDGHIVVEQYFGAMTPRTRHVLWSASKSVLASILARCCSDGTLDEHAPAEDYVPELSGTGFEGATLRQLMDMQTGLDAPCFPSPEELARRNVSKPEQWTFATLEFRRADNVFARTCRAQAVIRPLPNEPITGYCDFLMTLKRDRDHGKYFYYTDPNPMALQWILERKTDLSYVRHLSSLLGDATASGMDLDLFAGRLQLRLDSIRDNAPVGKECRETTPLAPEVHPAITTNGQFAPRPESHSRGDDFGVRFSMLALTHGAALRVTSTDGGVTPRDRTTPAGAFGLAAARTVAICFYGRRVHSTSASGTSPSLRERSCAYADRISVVLTR
jgi:hypothetical protein